MKHSFLWALVLLALWVLPASCFSIGAKDTTTKYVATIVIAKGSSFVYQGVGENEPIKYYGTGDTVYVELKGDTCYIDGQADSPHRAVPPKVYPVEDLKAKYGKVSFILEYVRSHSGDETEVWNRALHECEKQTERLCCEVVGRYAQEVRSHSLTPRAAADTAVATLRASPFVAAAYEDERSRRDDLSSRMIMLQWAGENDKELLILDPTLVPNRTRPIPTNLEKFQDFVGMLRMLEGCFPVRIEIRGGSLLVASVADSLKPKTNGER